MPSPSLEQEALDRVARMYSSFDRRSQSRREPPPEPKPPEPEKEPASGSKPEVLVPKPPEEKSPAGLMEALLRDKEQSLILLLLVILMKDGADANTVLALMYLLL